VDGDSIARSHEVAVLRFLKMKNARMLFGKLNNRKVSECAYFVVADSDRRVVVVAVRGTQVASDLMTDVSQYPAKMTVDMDRGGGEDDAHRKTRPGHCHAGVLHASTKLADELRPRLRSLLGEGGECSGYSLRLVGHSLGGSVAALATFLMRHDFPQARCVAQSPFPCLDAPAADAIVESGVDVTSFVYGDEFGPRTSAGSVFNLIRRAEAAATRERDAIATGSGSHLGTNLKKIAARGPFPGARAVASLFFGYLIRCMRQKGKNVNEDDLRFLEFDFDDGGDGNGRHEQFRASRGASLASPDHRLKRYRSSRAMDATPTSTEGIEDSADFESVPPGTSILMHPSVISSSRATRSSRRRVVSYLIPGTVIHVSPVESDGGGGAGGAAKRYSAKEVSAEEISVIRLTSSLFLDHLPWRLASAIKWIAEDCK